MLLTLIPYESLLFCANTHPSSNPNRSHRDRFSATEPPGRPRSVERSLLHLKFNVECDSLCYNQW